MANLKAQSPTVDDVLAEVGRAIDKFPTTIAGVLEQGSSTETPASEWRCGVDTRANRASLSLPESHRSTPAPER